MEEHQTKCWTLRGAGAERRIVVAPHTYSNDWRIAANCSLFAATSTQVVGPPVQFQLQIEFLLLGRVWGGWGIRVTDHHLNNNTHPPHTEDGLGGG